MRSYKSMLCLVVFVLCTSSQSKLFSQVPNTGSKLNEDSLFISQNYDKQEYMIPMRDGIKLYTVVYTPKDKTQKYPILLNRTPYAVGPYEANLLKSTLGPSMLFAREKFIFVYQDVRGKFMSEGIFVDVRPIIDVKKNNKEIDESSDTYDTIDWLIKNIGTNNGKVGVWGISYPGFYASAAAINAHPALVAVSPQAPIADWYWDDFHHHGTLFLPHTFNFVSGFGQPRPAPTTKWRTAYKHLSPDGYRFFLNEIGPLKNVNLKFFHDTVAFWNDLVAHPDYDAHWKARNILPHLKNIKPATLVVGGWYDAEDLYGVLKTYKAIETQNPDARNMLVMGPWRHGGWARDNGSKLGNVFFGDSLPASVFYQKTIELAFFMQYLKNGADPKLPEAYVFETGANRWRQFESWPPKNTTQKNLYFHKGGKLSFTAPSEQTDTYDEFISDPFKPVPYTEIITTSMTKEYMTEDQRFAGTRPDVLVYETEPLTEALTLAGSSISNLLVSITGTDADWVVKLIDVYPDTAATSKANPAYKMGGYQQMVRSEAFRGRYRNSYEKPAPFTPGAVTTIKFELQDVLHTFKKGHKIMIQVQSTWFPIMDRNPQKYVENIFKANESDFIKATHHVHVSAAKASYLQVNVLR
jgi:uncharacterized protein